MIYITTKQLPIMHQMTLEEFLFEPYVPNSNILNANKANTRTHTAATASEFFKKQIDVTVLIEKLEEFNQQNEPLRMMNRQELFETFYIPKRSGGLRRIDAPKPTLMNTLLNLKTIFEEDFRVLYHTSAFAYVKGRSTVDAIKRHQKNESKWFGKYDLSNFFGSTTLEFVMRQFSMIFPFCEVVKLRSGRIALETALELAFFNGGLPQGTPISPLITNVMMIPIDHYLSNTLRQYEKQTFVYTRYADDFLVSSRFDFDNNKVVELINGALAQSGAPFSLNPEKTRYGSSAGRNWNLGLMLNKDGEITVGHKKKKQFQCMLHNYIEDKKKGVDWPLHDVMTMSGYHSYYRMVEPVAIDGIIKHFNAKHGVDVLQIIKDDIRK